MLDVEVIDEPAAAAAVLDPVRSRLLAALREPGSATSIADAVGQSRQKVNYHLRALEDHGLVELLEERPRRGLTERVMAATARSYVVSPTALGRCAVEVGQTDIAQADEDGDHPTTPAPDRLSAGYLVALAARVVSEVGDLARRARRADKSLPTLALDADIRFATPADRAAFTRELAASVTSLAARYHDRDAPDGRWHRLLVAAHPRPTTAAEGRTRDHRSTEDATAEGQA